MQAQSNLSTSVWKKLCRRELTCSEALQQLISPEGMLHFNALDPEVSLRFFQTISLEDAPPVVPLLLWQNCYYLGSPVVLTPEVVRGLCDRTLTDIKVLTISAKSYRLWYYTRNAIVNQISVGPVINPLTGEEIQEDIAETTELHLAKAEDQIERIKTIIASALRNRASDIHLEPTGEGLRVRYRIDGVLRNITTLPPEVSRKVIVALKVMSSMDIADSRRPQDGRIGEQYTSGSSAQLDMDMRVSTLPCVCGEKAVIRLLPRENPFTTVEDLGFTSQALPIYQAWLEQPQGMIILTGPTGSGKTSTLYTSLQAIATEDVNVVTVEDPVEYVLSCITQSQVNELAGMTFAAGLRAILRQDPDVVMVGEIRDPETAETAVRAALTGHLVFTTLHTNDAIGAIPRLKDMGPDPGLVSDALLGVVAQRLVRRVCPHCAESYRPKDRDLQLLGLSKSQVANAQWRRGRGCQRCFNSGYLGREAIIELLEVDETVREIIHEGSTAQLRSYLRTTGFVSFGRAAAEKVIAGITTAEEVLRVLPRSVFPMAKPSVPIHAVPG
jgi:type II secretory ATPase GspE/PulE/Tfp pilus assembly ATPase PilB-like protein